MTPAGFPHSDISGSTSARDSPKLFAACHVLHRLLAPRHPPRALCSLTPPAPDLAASHRLGSIGIVSLTNSAKSKIDLLPNNSSSCKGAARRSEHPVRRRPGHPAVCWSVSSSGRSRIRRSMAVDTRRRLEDLPRSRLGTAPWFSVVPGSTRCLQLSDWCGLAQDRILRCGSRRFRRWWRRGDSNS